MNTLKDEPDKMTLDGAITYYEREAKEQHELYMICPWSDGQLCDGRDYCKSLKDGKNRGCIKLSNEYDQLVHWLKDYRNLRNPDDTHTEPTNALTKVLAETLDGSSDEAIWEGLHEAYTYAMDNSGDTDISAEPH